MELTFSQQEYFKLFQSDNKYILHCYKRFLFDKKYLNI